MDISQVSSAGQAGAVMARPEPQAKVVEAAPAKVAGVAVEAQPATPEQLQQATEMINRAVQSFSHNLQFSVDQDAKTTVVKVVDTQTNEVIRQMPSEEVMAIAKALDKLQGLLIRQKA